MLPQFHFNETEMLAFALVFLRVSAFLVSWPLFSVYSVPGHLKVLFAICIALVLFPVVDRSGLGGQGFGNEIAWLALKEVLTGLCLGFMTRLFFFAVTVGGNLIATASGLASGQVFNPTLGTTATTVEQFYASLGTLLFLGINGHHYFLSGLAESFHAIPLVLSGTDIASLGVKSSQSAALGGLVMKFKDSGLLLQAVVESGIKIAAPVMITVFLLNIVMGILGRAVPQVNVLVTSMPVNFMASMFVMIVAIPALLLQLDHDMISFTEMLFKIMRAV